MSSLIRYVAISQLLSATSTNTLMISRYDYDWMRNPVAARALTSSKNLSAKSEEELAELSSDRTLAIQFQDNTLLEFRPSLQFEYPLLFKEGLKALLPFPTTYLCEKSFSAMTAIKTNHRARLEPEADMRVALTTIQPRIESLCRKKQAHPSH